MKPKNRIHNRAVFLLVAELFLATTLLSDLAWALHGESSFMARGTFREAPGLSTLRPMSSAVQDGARKDLEGALRTSDGQAKGQDLPPQELSFLEELRKVLASRPIVTPIEGEKETKIKAVSAIPLRFHQNEWQVLLAKRSKVKKKPDKEPRYPGLWVFPSETREEEGADGLEKPLVAVLRGLWEELDLKLTQEDLLGRLGKFLTGDKEAVVLYFLFLVPHEKSEKLRLNPENERAEWVSLSLFLREEIREKNFLPEGQFGPGAEFGPVNPANAFAEAVKQARIQSMLPDQIQTIGKEVFHDLHGRKSVRPFLIRKSTEDPLLKKGLIEFMLDFWRMEDRREAKILLEKHLPRTITPWWVLTPMLALNLVPIQFHERLIGWPIRYFSHQFIAGESFVDVMLKLVDLWQNGITFSLAIIGEAARTEEEAEAKKEAYLDLVRRLAEAVENWKKDPILDLAPRVNLSAKLTALTSHLTIDNKEVVKRRLREMLQAAKQSNGHFWIDMEQYRYKDLTIQMIKEILEEEEFERFEGLGFVILAYFRDTEKDILELVEWAKRRFEKTGARTPLRFVKGADWDQEVKLAETLGITPPVFTKKWETDENYEKLSRLLLQNYRYFHLAFGTHNIRSLSNILATAQLLEIPKEAFEIQLLYGMGDPIAKELAKWGYRVRFYTPYGPWLDSIAYLSRRILESTSQESFLRQSLSGEYDLDELLKSPRQFAGAVSDGGEKVHYLEILAKGEDYYEFGEGLAVKLDFVGKGNAKLIFRVPEDILIEPEEAYRAKLMEASWTEPISPQQGIIQMVERPYFLRAFRQVVIGEGRWWLTLNQVSTPNRIALIEIWKGRYRGGRYRTVGEAGEARDGGEKGGFGETLKALREIEASEDKRKDPENYDRALSLFAEYLKEADKRYFLVAPFMGRRRFSLFEEEVPVPPSFADSLDHLALSAAIGLSPDSKQMDRAEVLSLLIASTQLWPVTKERIIPPKAKKLSFKGYQDTPLVGYFFETSDTSQKKYPTVIMLAPFGQSTLVLDDYVDFLQKNYSVNVLLLEMRHHGESGGEFFGLGHLESRDLPFVIDQLVQDESLRVDPEKIIGYGFSIGVTTWLMAERDHFVKPKALILDTFPLFEKNQKGKIDWGEGWKAFSFGLSREYAERAMEMHQQILRYYLKEAGIDLPETKIFPDPYALIRGIKTSSLVLIAGKDRWAREERGKDIRIRWFIEEEVKKALEPEGILIQSALIQGDHARGFVDDPVAYQSAVRQFLDYFLNPRKTPPDSPERFAKDGEGKGRSKWHPRGYKQERLVPTRPSRQNPSVGPQEAGMLLHVAETYGIPREDFESGIRDPYVLFRLAVSLRLYDDLLLDEGAVKLLFYYYLYPALTRQQLADKVGWHLETVKDHLYGRSGAHSPYASFIEYLNNEKRPFLVKLLDEESPHFYKEILKTALYSAQFTDADRKALGRRIDSLLQSESFPPRDKEKLLTLKIYLGLATEFAPENPRGRSLEETSKILSEVTKRPMTVQTVTRRIHGDPRSATEGALDLLGRWFEIDKENLYDPFYNRFVDETRRRLFREKVERKEGKSDRLHSDQRSHLIRLWIVFQEIIRRDPTHPFHSLDTGTKKVVAYRIEGKTAEEIAPLVGLKADVVLMKTVERPAAAIPSALTLVEKRVQEDQFPFASAEPYWRKHFLNTEGRMHWEMIPDEVIVKWVKRLIKKTGRSWKALRQTDYRRVPIEFEKGKNRALYALYQHFDELQRKENDPRLKMLPVSSYIAHLYKPKPPQRKKEEGTSAKDGEGKISSKRLKRLIAETESRHAPTVGPEEKERIFRSGEAHGIPREDVERWIKDPYVLYRLAATLRLYDELKLEEETVILLFHEYLYPEWSRKKLAEVMGRSILWVDRHLTGFHAPIPSSSPYRELIEFIHQKDPAFLSRLLEEDKVAFPKEILMTAIHSHNFTDADRKALGRRIDRLLESESTPSMDKEKLTALKVLLGLETPFAPESPRRRTFKEGSAILSMSRKGFEKRVYGYVDRGALDLLQTTLSRGQLKKEDRTMIEARIDRLLENGRLLEKNKKKLLTLKVLLGFKTEFAPPSKKWRTIRKTSEMLSQYENEPVSPDVVKARIWGSASRGALDILAAWFEADLENLYGQFYDRFVGETRRRLFRERVEREEGEEDVLTFDQRKRLGTLWVLFQEAVKEKKARDSEFSRFDERLKRILQHRIEGKTAKEISPAVGYSEATVRNMTQEYRIESIPPSLQGVEERLREDQFPPSSPSEPYWRKRFLGGGRKMHWEEVPLEFLAMWVQKLARQRGKSWEELSVSDYYDKELTFPGESNTRTLGALYQHFDLLKKKEKDPDNKTLTTPLYIAKVLEPYKAVAEERLRETSQDGGKREFSKILHFAESRKIPRKDVEEGIRDPYVLYRLTATLRLLDTRILDEEVTNLLFHYYLYPQWTEKEMTDWIGWSDTWVYRRLYGWEGERSPYRSLFAFLKENEPNFLSTLVPEETPSFGSTVLATTIQSPKLTAADREAIGRRIDLLLQNRMSSSGNKEKLQTLKVLLGLPTPFAPASLERRTFEETARIFSISRRGVAKRIYGIVAKGALDLLPEPRKAREILKKTPHRRPLSEADKKVFQDETDRLLQSNLLPEERKKLLTLKVFLGFETDFSPASPEMRGYGETAGILSAYFNEPTSPAAVKHRIWGSVQKGALHLLGAWFEVDRENLYDPLYSKFIEETRWRLFRKKVEREEGERDHLSPQQRDRLWRLWLRFLASNSVHLDPRIKEILRYRIEGKTAREISGIVQLSENTVRTMTSEYPSSLIPSALDLVETEIRQGQFPFTSAEPYWRKRFLSGQRMPWHHVPFEVLAVWIELLSRQVGKEWRELTEKDWYTVKVKFPGEKNRRNFESLYMHFHDLKRKEKDLSLKYLTTNGYIVRKLSPYREEAKKIVRTFAKDGAGKFQTMPNLSSFSYQDAFWSP